MDLTIAYITGRADPHLEWTIDTLEPQIRHGDEISLLVVDARGRSAGELASATRLARFEVVRPKPNAWQGPHRLTSCDWWAKSSAINTALVLCQTNYIAFVDDCCRLGPRWLDSVRAGYRARDAVLAGSYEKIEHGQVVGDHRRKSCPTGKRDCGGGWLYGCTYALPVAWALAIGGAEEGCDGMGSEDYIFGLMLQNAGFRIDFTPGLFVTQERPEVMPPSGPSAPLRRTDKGISPNDKSHAALRRFGVRSHTEFSPDLVALRRQFLVTGAVSWPLPDRDLRDWYDGQLVREMT